PLPPGTPPWPSLVRSARFHPEAEHRKFLAASQLTEVEGASASPEPPTGPTRDAPLGNSTIALATQHPGGKKRPDRRGPFVAAPHEPVCTAARALLQSVRGSHHVGPRRWRWRHPRTKGRSPAVSACLGRVIARPPSPSGSAISGSSSRWR